MTPGQISLHQGSIDYVQLAKSTVAFPLSVLARLTAADIATHTLVAGQAISAIFILSPSGIERCADVLKSLRSCSSVGDAICFGFGIRHIIPGRASSAEKSVTILTKLAEVCGTPNELRPSPQQWLNIVGACSGILRPTTFAGQFMAFWNPSTAKNSGSGWTENAEDTATAL
ncbi:hypothetical protein QBC38DRAFT_526388 [Podospora fimiseda]|uniref:Uncharacterized protein n=1 Tax=Podospora fimiseda TaxID=252190 RepID=A0AAN6YJS7_9PEZI|nr:hypothetical protein QBC38DRAFT_526388 [Podospora fimiseda]